MNTARAKAHPLPIPAKKKKRDREKKNMTTRDDGEAAMKVFILWGKLHWKNESGVFFKGRIDLQFSGKAAGDTPGTMAHS